MKIDYANLQVQYQKFKDDIDASIHAVLNKSNYIMGEQVKKLETREEMLQGASMLKNAGVPFSAYFMVGFPGETDDDVRETIDFAKKIEADYYSLSVLAPYYGTELYDQLIENGYELDKQPWEYFFHQSPKPMVNDKISTKMLQEFLSLNDLNKKNKKRRGYV